MLSDVYDESEYKIHANSKMCRTGAIGTVCNPPIVVEDIPMETNDCGNTDDVQYSSESDDETDTPSDASDDECLSSDEETEDIYNESIFSDPEEDNNYGEAEETQFPHNQVGYISYNLTS